MSKSVSFNLEQNIIYDTYSFSDYNRTQIDSFVYKMTFKQVTNKKLLDIFNQLNKYKLEEMVVHKDSLCNTRLH